jgi:signal transduction histidine kinase
MRPSSADSVDPQHTAKLREILVQDLYRRSLLPVVFFVPILYLLYRVVQAAVVARPIIQWIFLAMILVLVPRIAAVLLGARFKARFPDPRIRLAFFATTAALLGCGMAATNILAAPVVGPEQLAIMAIIAAGINSIAIISMSPSLLSYLLYMVPNIVSMGVAVLIGPQLEYSGTLLFLVCLILVSLIVMATYVHWGLRSSIVLRLQVDEANAALRDTNSRLQSEIGERQAAEAELRQRNSDLEVANRNLAEAHSQLLHSEKLASVGQLAAGIAHEINNPLAFVSSNFGHLGKYTNDMLGLLDAYEDVEAGTGDVGVSARRLQQLKHAANLDLVREDLPSLIRESSDGLARVARIVRDLKEFTNVDRSGWQRVDLRHSIEQTLGIAMHRIRNKADIVRDFAPVQPVECMPAEVNQALLNLLINAAQAIAARGTITLRTYEEDAFVCAEIADTGCGIDPENLSRIFDPFFTTREVGAGIGLGLTTVYRIAQKHQGRIDVKSTPGEGSTFILRLPISR